MHPRCQSCEYIGKNGADLDKHRNDCHSEALLPCQNCQATFASQQDLKMHMSQYHNVVRSRVFSSRRISTSRPETPKAQSPSVFRPWSGSHNIFVEPANSNTCHDPQPNRPPFSNNATQSYQPKA